MNAMVVDYSVYLKKSMQYVKVNSGFYSITLKDFFSRRDAETQGN